MGLEMWTPGIFLQILSPRFTNFESAFYKFLSQRFTSPRFTSPVQSIPVHEIQYGIMSTGQFTFAPGRAVKFLGSDFCNFRVTAHSRHKYLNRV